MTIGASHYPWPGAVTEDNTHMYIHKTMWSLSKNLRIFIQCTIFNSFPCIRIIVVLFLVSQKLSPQTIKLYLSAISPFKAQEMPCLQLVQSGVQRMSADTVKSVPTNLYQELILPKLIFKNQFTTTSKK